MNKLILALFAIPMLALSQGATNDYIFYQKPASGPLVVRAVTPTVGRLMGWPTSISAPASITLGTGLSLSGSTLNATASSAWGDLTGIPAAITTLSSATAAGLAIMDDANAAAQRTTLGLAIGTNVQAFDSDLSTWAGVTPAAGVATFLATPSSANLRATVTDETGSGSLVFANSPTLTTPAAEYYNGFSGADGSSAGFLKLTGGSGGAGTSAGGGIDLRGGSVSGVQGCFISGYGGSATGTSAGTIYTYGGTTAGASGGIIYTYGQTLPGGNINTSDGGGSISTRGTGSIEFGALGTRTTLVGSAATTDKTITMPNATGTILLTDGNGSALTALNASNISSGSLALARIDQAGATSGQAIAWNGSAWAPATISSGATLAANTYTGLQQFSGTTHAGLRLNNLTTAERDALTGAAGMAVWNTTDGRLQLHNGSAWTSGMVRLSGDTMTGALTITQGTANTGILTSTGYSLTGSNATTMIDLAGTWNTSGTPTAIKLNITNTASNAASSLIDIQSGGTSRFKVLATGGTTLGGGASSPLSIVSSTGTVTFTATGDGSLLQDKSVILPATGYVRFGFVGSNDPIITGASSSLTISQITSFQLGANTATASATAPAQTIKGPNATGTTSTGGSLTLAGGTGTSAGGAVVITTAATTTQATAVTVSKDGVTTFAKPPVVPVYTVATLPATAAAGMVQGAHAIVTDATTPTYLGALTGGGAVVCPVFYNGTAWVSH